MCRHHFNLRSVRKRKNDRGASIVKRGRSQSWSPASQCFHKAPTKRATIAQPLIAAADPPATFTRWLIEPDAVTISSTPIQSAPITSIGASSPNLVVQLYKVIPSSTLSSGPFASTAKK